MPAIKVIAITLGHLKDLMLRDIDQHFQHPNRKIQWILTVPAIWSEAAKQIMREAASQVCISISLYYLYIHLCITIIHLKGWQIRLIIKMVRTHMVKLMVIIRFALCSDESRGFIGFHRNPFPKMINFLAS